MDKIVTFMLLTVYKNQKSNADYDKKKTPQILPKIQTFVCN